MAKLIKANRKATNTKITAQYDSGEQQGTSECTDLDPTVCRKNGSCPVLAKSSGHCVHRRNTAINHKKIL